MAQIRYRRIPEASLIDLSDDELRVLDLALAYYRDKLHKNVDAEQHYHRVTADQLHDQVLLIMKGENISDE
jgi:hypothetical protein